MTANRPPNDPDETTRLRRWLRLLKLALSTVALALSIWRGTAGP